MSAFATLAVFIGVFAQGPRALDAGIAEVTVFPGRALVRRHADIAGGAGRYVISGLPAAMDPQSVRVRCGGADVVGIEIRERFQSKVPEARVEALRAKERDLKRELSALEDESASFGAIAAHLERSLVAPPAPSGDKQAAITIDAWSRNLDFVVGELTRLRASRRDLARRIDEVKVRLADVERDIGACDPMEGVSLRDVHFDLAGPQGEVTLDLEYLVSGANWSPRYDLRASSDGRKVELGYRADVWQTTGEDWSEVDVALSTARPRLGAQGPDPEPIWLRFVEPDLRRKRSLGYTGAGADRRAGEQGDDDEQDRVEATAEQQGLSMRFRLARRETIPSRREPSSVLVGSAVLDATPEYFCAPELDTNVWLRGRTINTSPWALLPGRAAVYFGTDFLGHAMLGSVLPQAEFTLHLGPDPTLTVERTTLADVVEEPGIFSSKATHKESFRIRIENHGAAVTRADGTAAIFVRETLPRSRDERLEVELDSAKNKPLDDARWKKDRDEKGTVTWLVLVPKSGEAVLEYTRRIIYPAKATVLHD